MAVSAERVVRRHHRRTPVTDDPHQTADGLGEVRRPEGVVVIVVFGSHHPRVAVAEELDAGGAQDLGGGARLLAPPLGEILTIIQEVLGDLAFLAVGGHCKDDTMALCRGARHRAPGRDRLVVGVRMEEDDGRHGGPP